MSANPIRYGAFPEEWERFKSLPRMRLLPVVSNPNIETAPESKIPAENRGKVPTRLNSQRQVVGIKDWPTMKLSPEQIQAAIAKQPDYGFCVVTGHGMIALDCDITDAALADEIKSAIDITLGCDFPIRKRSNSTKFLVPLHVPGAIAKTVIPTRAGKIEILGRGQQFVAAGTHPSGARIEWEWPETGVPQLTLAQFQQLVEQLGKLFAVEPVEPVHEAKPASQSDAPAIPTDPDQAVERAKLDLRSREPAIENQGGDFWTLKTAMLVHDHGVPLERAAEALEEWNERCSPPWAPDELDVKIRSAYKYAKGQQGSRSLEAVAQSFEVEPDDSAPDYSEPRSEQPQQPAANETAEPEQQPAAPEGQQSKGVVFVRPRDVRPEHYLGSDYLIKGWLDRRSNAVLFGDWNIGKSFVVLDMCAAIAGGLPWFGNRVKPGRVLYATYEGMRAMSKRQAALKTKYPKLDEYPFAIGALHSALTTQAGRDELKALLDRFHAEFGGPPDLLVIDPLQQALGGDDGDASAMGVLNQEINHIMKGQRCTVLRVHHSGHGNKSRARGHSSLPASADAEIRLESTGERRGEIASTKQRDSIKGKLAYQLNIVTLGQDQDGDPVTSCAVSQTAPGAFGSLPGGDRATLAEKRVMEAFQNATMGQESATEDDILAAAAKVKGWEGMRPSNRNQKARAAIEALVERELLEPERQADGTVRYWRGEGE
jgi:hypothetical protein